MSKDNLTYEILTSVVMAVYINDNLNYLKEAVDSLLNQTVMPDEIIIVIDGQISLEVKQYLENLKIKKTLIRLIFLEKNAGLANALNVGIRAAKGNIIIRMDADDICFENRLELQLDYFKNNDVDVLGGQIIGFGTNISDLIIKRSVPVNHEDIAESMKIRPPFNHPTVIFKKEVFESLNGYSTEFFPEDQDFFVRAKMCGFKLANLNEKILYYRLGKDLSSMIKRRHGFKFAKKELILLWHFYKIGFYSFLTFLKNILLKTPLRILPFSVFKFIYIRFAK